MVRRSNVRADLTKQRTNIAAPSLSLRRQTHYKEAHRYLDPLAVPQTVHLQLIVIYICNGEKLVLENCNIRDTSDTTNCLVQHPDRPTHNGLVAYTNETRGTLKKLIPTCQQPSVRGVVPTPSATAKTK